ncbi:hypothetical protein BU23DRAFT_57511 [Bimuria novae-zelandiae CBS 107.79]|uniref:Uncharacterized protein n=1 Tax=Bimuria novae-zelandiae CBS 107.79 TaxID=1447943 RepID=A0A6A5VFJ8_9PLEO|nr:hypothetical protein BU23DRAFT_57511 [Bimuria novae-zelandiae CBS 107.79]
MCYEPGYFHASDIAAQHPSSLPPSFGLCTVYHLFFMRPVPWVRAVPLPSESNCWDCGDAACGSSLLLARRPCVRRCCDRTSLVPKSDSGLGCMDTPSAPLLSSSAIRYAKYQSAGYLKDPALMYLRLICLPSCPPVDSNLYRA